MRLPVLIHRPRLGPDEFRVIRPSRPLPRAVLIDFDRYLGFYLDQHAARTIGGLWALAARSPRSLIHVPIRTSPSPNLEMPIHEGTRLDLVLLHHSLQFAPSRWKRIRGHLGPGRPQTTDLPGPGHSDVPASDHEARHYKENRDLFRQHLHADTLFMTGSAKVFEETAHRFLDIANQGPGYAPINRDHQHFCTEFHWNEGVLGKAREIHIEYCDRWAASAVRQTDTQSAKSRSAKGRS
ncbi:hypothetical protein [Streptomyces sp. NPDC048473]|uniref:hypothetical protein n=1 Tax=unclassified Streptomyces TaxID=2593676 RepID=UPI0037139A50